MDTAPNITALVKRVAELEKENALLKKDFSNLAKGNSVKVPEPMQPLFNAAEQTVNEYFRHLNMDPSKGTIEINDQRYVLVRASGLSKDFLDTIQKLYADRGEAEAMSIGKNFLFDIAHVIGMNDAKNFHVTMNLTDPIAKLSAGPIHFAYTGWAFVDILPESNPTPDENFYLIYNHPYSFEADSWKRAGKKSNTPICIMNAGYSSGWCEESFGIPLTAAEVSCTAKGDDFCTFIMSPPHRIQEHLAKFNKEHKSSSPKKDSYEIPTFFERKSVEEEMQKSKVLAEESAKSKSDFVANMSHELRTPLGIILGFTDLLKKTDLSAQQKEYLGAINSSGNSLLSIINDILDLSKLDAGKFIIESIPFNVSDLLHSVQAMFHSKATEKNLEFICKVDDDVNRHLSGDPMRLTQILINLIGNALKFTEKGGVYISCGIKEKQENNLILQFSIKDTGIGITEDKIINIFERFTQADTNITRKYGGTGLGLAITKQLIELQGGNISLQSGSMNGAEFIFTLPYAISDGEHAAIIYKETPDVLDFGEVKKILVVDDNIFNQKLATNILQNNGFTVTVAENGGAAIDILKDEAFDIILMDIQMPVMDGYKATQMIREELQITIPVIAMTAHALAGEKEKCILSGMNDYLSKPFKEKELLLKISTWAKPVDNKVAAETEQSMLSLSFLAAQTKNNKEFIKEMINIFVKQNPLEISEMQNAINNKDFEQVYKTAHLIRNSIFYFGLSKAIGNSLSEIERLAKAEVNTNEIEENFALVRDVCNKAVEELKSIDLN